MKEVITVENMRISDAKTISSGVPGIELMYLAAKGVFESYSWSGKIGIFCGSGNNAGDGYALATILASNNYDCEVINVTDRFSPDGLYYYNKCKAMDIVCRPFSTDLKYDIYVDCLLGTGFKGLVKGEIAECISYLNEDNKVIVSVDINSGLNGDLGLADVAVKSDVTVSIGYLKTGLFLNKAKDYIKTIKNVDIGIKAIDKPFYLLEKNDVKTFFKPRFNYSNKGTYGYVGIMGGSREYPGAPRLANMGQTSLYAGCGVSRLIIPADIYELIFNNVLETTITKIPSKDGKMIFDEVAIKNSLKGLKALGIGVGWGTSHEYGKILKYILENYDIPIVIDADGINTLANMDLEILNLAKSKIILTPHIKEFSRLNGYSVDYILNNLVSCCLEFTKKYNVTLLVKGPTTIVCNCDNLYLIDRGCAGMATAGSGDVLTGILVGLLGYHFEDITLTTAVASYINGYSGELAMKEYGDISMVASDTAKMVSKAIMRIRSDNS